MKYIRNLIIKALALPLLSSCGGPKLATANEQMERYAVTFPEDAFALIKFEDNGMPGVGIINKGLHNFGFKEVFGWYCEVNIVLEATDKQSLPSNDETDVLYALEDKLQGLISGDDKNHPNALFVGHLINNGVMTSMWMVNNPEVANGELSRYISTENYPRHFKFVIKQDLAWKSVAHLLRS